MLKFLQTFLSRYETFKTGKTGKTGKTLLKKPYFSMGLGSYLWSYQNFLGKTFNQTEGSPAHNLLP